MNNETCIWYDSYVKEMLKNFFKDYSYIYGNKTPTFVCLGEPKIIGDSLGPIIGSILETMGYEVYGTLDNPITKKNVNEIYYKLWAKTFSKSPVITIDAAVGGSRVGSIKYNTTRGLLPGSGFGKEIEPIGNIGFIVVTGRNMVEYLHSNQSIITAVSSYIASNIHTEFCKLRKGI